MPADITYMVNQTDLRATVDDCRTMTVHCVQVRDPQLPALDPPYEPQEYPPQDAPDQMFPQVAIVTIFYPAS